MTLHYRETDPVSGRWTGNTSGVPLSSFQGDENIFTLQAAIAAVAATVTPSRSISSITTSGNDITFHMSDSTLEGPFTIIPATFNGRGEWAPSTDFSLNDTFYINGTVYLVTFPHTSALTFSAGANDGMGHNYYAVMVPNPGNAFPTGGAVGQVPVKSTTADFAVTWGWKLPTGGTARQYLIKINGTQDNAAWGTPTASDIAFAASTGSTLTATNVSAAIEEAALTGGGGATTLEALTDVRFPTAGPVAGDLFSFNGTHWVNIAESTLSLSFTQMTGSLSAAQLRDATITALDTTGAVFLDPTLGNIFTVTPTGDMTITANSIPADADITIIVVTSGTTSRTITFSSGTFKSTATLVTGTVSGKYFSIRFIGISSPASWFVETSRTPAM